MISKSKETKRIAGITRLEIVVTVVLILSCLGLVGAWPGWAFILLLIGWVKYPIEAADDLTIEWVSVTVACLALIVFTWGVHYFGQWLTHWKSTDENQRRWSFRNSIQSVALILFAFLAGTSMIGIVHQVVWLTTTEERWLDPSGARIAWYRNSSKNNLKQIGLAHHYYHDKHESFAISTFAADGAARHSWQTYLLPYVEQAPLYQQIDLDRSWTAPANREHFAVAIPVYENPGVDSHDDLAPDEPAVSHYAGNLRLLQSNRAATLKSIVDGPASTILGGEVHSRFKPWGHPANLRDPVNGINQTPNGFGSPFPGGAQFLFADGSARFLPDDIDPAILKALATPAGGEEITDVDY